MLLLNFAHPLKQSHLARIEEIAGEKIERVLVVDSRVDTERPLGPQIRAMVDSVGLSPEEWQTVPLVVNPPSLNYSAVALVAELHGRMGYFPPCMRMRPVLDGSGQRVVPPRFEVAEVFNLQAIRDEARLSRF